jgi:putative glutamine amidotransferase
MEAAGDRFCVGVQWHPETAADVGLLAGLVAAAAAYRSAS